MAALDRHGWRRMWTNVSTWMRDESRSWPRSHYNANKMNEYDQIVILFRILFGGGGNFQIFT